MTPWVQSTNSMSYYQTQFLFYNNNPNKHEAQSRVRSYPIIINWKPNRLYNESSLNMKLRIGLGGSVVKCDHHPWLWVSVCWANKMGEIIWVGSGGRGGGRREVITHTPPTKYDGKTLQSFESWGERFFSNCICSVNCQLAYSRKERVPDSLFLLLFFFGCFRVWHQEISSSSFWHISKEITHSSHHPNAHMIQIRLILGIKTSETPQKIYYYYIKAFTGAGI